MKTCASAVIMIFRYHYIIFFLCLLAGLLQDTSACRYNVRETGFADLETQRYVLTAFINDHTPEHLVADMKSIAGNLFLRSNILFEIINIERQPDHPGIAYLGTRKIRSYPAMVLVSPDGHSHLIPFAQTGTTFKQAVRKAFNQILFSSVREDLKKKVMLYYGVILLVEGGQDAEIKRAEEAINEAIRRIQKNMDLMPKPIKNPPLMIRLKKDELAIDPLLLWTLGLDADKVDKPYAAVYYGRARWLGPLFKDKEITSNNLTELLLIIGADCECGLDKNWLQGTMLPMRWDKDDQAIIAENLGFDPENPLIKMEINHIMRMGYFKADELDRSAGIDSVPGNRKGITYVNKTAKTTAVNSVETDLTKDEPLLARSLYISAAILGLMLIVGLIFLLRRTVFKRTTP
jgi:hypothetical protein